MAIIRQEFEEKIKPDGYKERVYPVTTDRAVYRYNHNSITLDDMLSEGYRYEGIAVPSTNPSLIQRQFYLASQEGTYTHFLDRNSRPIAIAENEGLIVLTYNEQYWSKTVLGDIGGGGGTTYPLVIKYGDEEIYTYDPSTGGEDFDIKTLLDNVNVESANKLSTSRNIFNIPFDGTQDVQGDNTSGKIPLIRAGLFTDQIYPLFYTRELGGCGRAIPNNVKNYFPTGIVCNNYTWWGGFYSRKICKNLDNNLWSFEKGYCGVGGSVEEGPLTGIIDIRIPNTSYAKYTIEITNVQGLKEDASTITVETYMDNHAVLQKWIYKQTAITDYNVRIAKIGDVHHILIGDLANQFAYYTITIKATIAPNSVCGSALSASGADKIEQYVDSVFDYITVDIIQSESAYTGNFIDPTKFTNYVKTEGNSRINGNIDLRGNLTVGNINPQNAGNVIGTADSAFNKLHVLKAYESPNYGLKHFSHYLRIYQETPVGQTEPIIATGLLAIRVATVPYANYDIKVSNFGAETKKTIRVDVSLAFNNAVASNNVITTQGTFLDWGSAVKQGSEKLDLNVGIAPNGEAYILIGDATTQWQTALILMDCVSAVINNLNVHGLESIYAAMVVPDTSSFTSIYPLVTNGGSGDGPDPDPDPSNIYVFDFGGGSTVHTQQVPSTSGTAYVPVISTKNNNAQGFTINSNSFSNGTVTISGSNVEIAYNSNSSRNAITGVVILKQIDSDNTITLNINQEGNSSAPTLDPMLQISNAAITGNILTFDLTTAEAKTAASTDITNGTLSVKYWGDTMNENNALYVHSNNWAVTTGGYRATISLAALQYQTGVNLKLESMTVTSGYILSPITTTVTV